MTKVAKRHSLGVYVCMYVCMCVRLCVRLYFKVSLWQSRTHIHLATHIPLKYLFLKWLSSGLEVGSWIPYHSLASSECVLLSALLDILFMCLFCLGKKDFFFWIKLEIHWIGKWSWSSLLSGQQKRQQQNPKSFSRSQKTAGGSTELDWWIRIWSCLLRKHGHFVSCSSHPTNLGKH